MPAPRSGRWPPPRPGRPSPAPGRTMPGAPPTPKSKSPMNPNHPNAALNAPNRSAPSQWSRSGAVTNEVTAATADDTSPVAIVRVDRRARDTTRSPPRPAFDWRQSKRPGRSNATPPTSSDRSQPGLPDQSLDPSIRPRPTTWLPRDQCDVVRVIAPQQPGDDEPARGRLKPPDRRDLWGTKPNPVSCRVQT